MQRTSSGHGICRPGPGPHLRSLYLVLSIVAVCGEVGWKLLGQDGAPPYGNRPVPGVLPQRDGGPGVRRHQRASACLGVRVLRVLAGAHLCRPCRLAVVSVLIPYLSTLPSTLFANQPFWLKEGQASSKLALQRTKRPGFFLKQTATANPLFPPSPHELTLSQALV